MFDSAKKTPPRLLLGLLEGKANSIWAASNQSSNAHRIDWDLIGNWLLLYLAMLNDSWPLKKENLQRRSTRLGKFKPCPNLLQLVRSLVTAIT